MCDGRDPASVWDIGGFAPNKGGLNIGAFDIKIKLGVVLKTAVDLGNENALACVKYVAVNGFKLA